MNSLKQERGRIILLIVSVLLMVAGARIEWSLPISDVPFIWADWILFIQALLLGGRWGAATSIIYVLLGAAGAPVYAGGGQGVEHLMGPTGGYLIGYIAAAAICGWMSERGGAKWYTDLFGWFLGAVVLFSLGILILAHRTELNIAEAVQQGFIPFVPVAIAKGVSAVGIAHILRPLIKLSYR